MTRGIVLALAAAVYLAVAVGAALWAGEARGEFGPRLDGQEFIVAGGLRYTLCKYSDGVTLTLNGHVQCPQRFQ